MPQLPPTVAHTSPVRQPGDDRGGIRVFRQGEEGLSNASRFDLFGKDFGKEFRHVLLPFKRSGGVL
jgi:hypothetical protein